MTWKQELQEEMAMSYLSHLGAPTQVQNLYFYLIQGYTAAISSTSMSLKSLLFFFDTEARTF